MTTRSDTPVDAPVAPGATTPASATAPVPTSASASPATSAGPAPHPGFADAFRQPKPVWAIAFAATVSFMGIGLVDPILPAISAELHASPTQAMLLFTSYLFITAIAMFFTSWIA
ncbi:hypothetical protein [Brachybacterium huguangmaarense]